MLELREYQTAVIAEIEAKIAQGAKRLIVVAPTGSGKTVIISEVIKRASAAYQRTVFIAHRDELLTQARDKLKSFDVIAGIIKAGRDADARPQAMTQVCGIQTLHARAIRAKSMELPPAEIFVIDEAHHVRAQTYMTILAQYPDAIVIGLTATPARGDGRGLGNVFQAMVQCPQIPALIEAGYLSKSKIFAPAPPDLRGVRVMSTGDYNVDELSAAMDPLVGDVILHWLKHAERRRTIVFAVDVKHSIHLANEFIKSGIRAEHLDGDTPQADRDAILARLASGETEVVTNCMILCEGFDLPDIGSIVLARPTRSLVLFRQMIGRGLRPAANKENVVILDHSGGVHRFGRPDDVIEWTLDTDQKATNKTHEARVKAAGGSVPFCECKACGHLRMKGMACDNCGWEPKKPGRDVDVVDGELIELGAVNRGPTESDRIAFFCELRGYQRTARKKDGTPYHPKWAACQYKDKHKVWPAREWEAYSPIEPSDATRRWIKSRIIAYSKAREAAR